MNNNSNNNKNNNKNKKKSLHSQLDTHMNKKNAIENNDINTTCVGNCEKNPFHPNLFIRGINNYGYDMCPTNNYQLAKENKLFHKIFSKCDANGKINLRNNSYTVPSSMIDCDLILVSFNISNSDDIINYYNNNNSSIYTIKRLLNCLWSYKNNIFISIDMVNIYQEIIKKIWYKTIKKKLYNIIYDYVKNNNYDKVYRIDFIIKNKLITNNDLMKILVSYKNKFYESNGDHNTIILKKIIEFLKNYLQNNKK